MLITNATEHDLVAAITKCNKCFSNNIVWNTCRTLNAAHTRWRVTLRCRSSREPGHRRSFTGWRRMVSACWHVHGVFIDALPSGAVVHAARVTTRAGAPWQDFNIGSTMRPLYMSDACDCGANGGV